jgi:hypothetical protein
VQGGPNSPGQLNHVLAFVERRNDDRDFGSSRREQRVQLSDSLGYAVILDRNRRLRSARRSSRRMSVFAVIVERRAPLRRL